MGEDYILTWRESDIETEIFDQYPDVAEQDIDYLVQEVEDKIRTNDYLNRVIGEVIAAHVSEEIDNLKREIGDGEIHED